jgi:DNA-binding NtrC family response regulator
MAPWPGNVRELRNTLERAVIVCGGQRLDLTHLSAISGSAGPREASTLTAHSPAVSGNSLTVPLGTSLNEAEKQLILRTLAAQDNNKTRAARVLGISLKTLHNKLRAYGGS